MVDVLPEGPSTTGSILPGQTFTSELDTVGDRDWVRIELIAGEWVTISLDGTGATALADPYLRIYDADGNLITMDDDTSSSYNSQTTIGGGDGGVYYIEAASYADSYAGEYTITATSVSEPSSAGLMDTLTWGTELADTNVTVYFVPSGQSADGYTSEGWTAYEIAQFEAAFAQISAVTNLTFTVTTDPNADFQLVLDTNQINGGFLGYFNPPGEFNAGVGVFDGSSWDRTAGGDLEQGGFGYVTIVHELLHGLGMSHPHDIGGSSGIMTGVDYPFEELGINGINQGIFTTMSYNSGYLGAVTPANGTYGYEAGPMALDIAVLQSIYGVNATTALGDDTYVLPDANGSGTAWQAIWDNGGTDTISYGGAGNVTIDLRAATLTYSVGGGGYVSAADGIAGGYTIANGVVIENATGGSGNDTLTGNDVANVLTGNGGADTITGGMGDDTLNGGAGADNLDGGVGNDTIDGGTDNDNANGGAGYDAITVTSGANTIYGGSGLDTLTGGIGADTIYGGSNHDTISGGGGADALHGERGNDTLSGGDQDDVLNGGLGTDTMTGGLGADTFVFLRGSESTAGTGNRDVITDFEVGVDTIDLSGIDADTGTAGDQAFTFGGAGQVSIVVDGADSIVQIDRDGDGFAEMEIFVTGVTTLAVDDFIL